MIMVQNNMFDYIHDSQETFRLMLDAVSNPGQIVSISKQMEKSEDNLRHLLVIALTLLDNETSYSVVDDDGFEKLLGQVTYADNKDEMASYIFVSQKCSAEKITEILTKSNPGTMTDPHTSSTLIISADEDEKSVLISLLGPGIKSSKTVEIHEYVKQWIIQRDKINYEYPLGIDMYFVSRNGDLLSIPRKVKMKG